MFRINSTSIKKQDENDDDFMGEHFCGHGNKWDALFGTAEYFMVEHMVKSVKKSSVLCQQEINGNKYAGLVYPDNSPIQVMSIIEAKDNKNEFTSAYPFLEGINNNLVVSSLYPWENQMEGEIAACADEGQVFNFFDPLFAKDLPYLEPNKEKTFSLAALAYDIEYAENQVFQINKGGFYEVHLKEFLEANPEKTKEDCPYVELKMEGCKMLLPTKETCVWEFRSSILDIEYIDFLDEKIAKMKIEIPRYEDEMMNIYLYAARTLLNGYNPQVGDEIQGILWLSGYLAS